MDCRIFFPTSRRDFIPSLTPNQRYRFPFGDQRLSSRYDSLSDKLIKKETAVIHQLSMERKEIMASYRFLGNNQVDLGELINHSTEIKEDEIRGKELQVNLDRSSFGMNFRNTFNAKWAKSVGVIEDNRTAGFYLTPALVLEQESQNCLALADILLHTRPLAKGSTKHIQKIRSQRSKLPFESKESSAWAIVASNTAGQLESAKRVTFVIDKAGDSYDIFHHILTATHRDFIIRAKTNRSATLSSNQLSGTYSELLDSQPWSDIRTVKIRALDHYSKSSGKRVRRKKREAQLAIRFIEITLDPPTTPNRNPVFIDQTLTLVEVLEVSDTVPHGELPIHWRLLSSWKVDKASTAWTVVKAYQGRWHIEQLFRCCKKQGMGLERTQLRKPESIMKLAIMSMKASVEALRLTQARDGKQFVPIESMFNKEKQQLLQKLNTELSGKTEKVTNPHQKNSLAWAAWIIARLGGWKGYDSQRKPGPITMTKGLIKFNDLLFWTEAIDSSP